MYLHDPAERAYVRQLPNETHALFVVYVVDAVVGVVDVVDGIMLMKSVQLQSCVCY